MTSCRFALDDGAYVLGALGPAERAEFEHHLADCPSCRRAVATSAVLPGLLSRLDEATVSATIGSTLGAPPTLVPRTLQAITRHRVAERRRRWWFALGGAVVTALCVLVGLGVYAVATPTPEPPPGAVLTAMRPATADPPVTAELGLTSIEGGSRIEMKCQYAEGIPGSWTVRLMVYPVGGQTAEQAASWTAFAGQRLHVEATTHLRPDEIARIDLQGGDSAVRVLTWSRP